MSPDPADSLRWSGYSHEEILAMVQAGPGRAASQYASGRWDSTWFTIEYIEANLSAAVSDAGSGWTGRAADAMTAGTTPLGQWALRAAQQAQNTAHTVDAQAGYADYTRREMPPIPHPEVVAGTAHGPRPYLASAPIMTDWAAVERDRDNAAARARELMETYGSNSASTLPGMLASEAPPSVVVQDTAAGSGPAGAVHLAAHHGRLAITSAAGAGPGGGVALTPGGENRGTGGGAAQGGTAGGAGPGVLVGSGGGGGSGAGGGAAGGRRAGGGGQAGGGGVAAGGPGGARAESVTGAQVVGGRVGPGATGLTGGSGGGGTGQVAGIGPIGNGARRRPGSGSGSPPGSGGIGLPGSGAGTTAWPPGSGRAPAGGGPTSGGSSTGGGSSGSPTSGADPGRPHVPWAPPGDPAGDPSGGSRWGGGRVAAAPLPPPAVLDRGSPERPFPSSAPPAGQAGEGLLPMGAGGMGGSRHQEHRRPAYLVDDGTAFADDRRIPAQVINEGDAHV